jgi:Transposase.
MASPNTYDPEIRRAAVQLALTCERSRKDIAGEFGIGVSTLSRWVREDRDTLAAEAGVSLAPEARTPSARARALGADLADGGGFVQYFDGNRAPQSPRTGPAYSRHDATGTEVAFVRLENGRALARASGPTDGYSIRTSDAFEAAASGRRIAVSVIARGAGGGSARFALAYSTNEVGNSRWRWQEAGSDWAVHGFDYDVPVMKQGRGDFIGILPDVEGRPGVDVFLVVARVL